MALRTAAVRRIDHSTKPGDVFAPVRELVF